MTSFYDGYFQLENLKYYTVVSNIVFYLVVILYLVSYLTNSNCIPNWLLYAVIVNILGVALIGNGLYCCNYEKVYQATESVSVNTNPADIFGTLHISNFIGHTLPFLVSIVMILLIEPYAFKMSYSLAFLAAFAALWLLIPSPSGQILHNKVNEVYLDPPLTMFLLLPIVWIVFLYLIQYSQKKREQLCFEQLNQ